VLVRPPAAAACGAAPALPTGARRWEGGGGAASACRAAPWALRVWLFGSDTGGGGGTRSCTGRAPQTCGALRFSASVVMSRGGGRRPPRVGAAARQLSARVPRVRRR